MRQDIGRVAFLKRMEFTKVPQTNLVSDSSVQQRIDQQWSIFKLACQDNTGEFTSERRARWSFHAQTKMAKPLTLITVSNIVWANANTCAAHNIMSREESSGCYLDLTTVNHWSSRRSVHFGSAACFLGQTQAFVWAFDLLPSVSPVEQSSSAPVRRRTNTATKCLFSVSGLFRSPCKTPPSFVYILHTGTNNGLSFC